jgi:formylglycine-generating enzyme required for sulfatase activity
MNRLFLGTATLAALGCSAPEGPARAQWLVTVATDAPVPQFGDRLLVDVLTSDGAPCGTCARELDAATNDDWPVSFGIEPPAGEDAPRLRVRLFRTADTGPDGPISDRILDSLVKLPPADGLTEVGVTLEMSCFGVAADLAAGTSCAPASGTLSPLATARAPGGSTPEVGSWAPAKPRDCGADPDPGMQCIPGGAFLMGNPSYLPLGDGLDPVPEQLVQVLPFFLDDHEITLGEISPLFDEIGVPGLGADCTYKQISFDPAAPVNCVTRDYARMACEKLAKRLPREAEWEWAASNTTEETPYPWVDGFTDACLDAVVGRSHLGAAQPHDSCLSAVTDPTGIVVGGNPRDKTRIGILNLGGNLEEWIDDQFIAYDDDRCWGTQVTLHVDPVCSAGSLVPIRGGAWDNVPSSAHSYQRNSSPDGGAAPNVGFRCARPATTP